MDEGYQKIEARVTPPKHMVTVCKGMTGKQIKEYFLQLPDQVLLDDITYCHFDNAIMWTFHCNEDELEWKMKLKEANL
jgi:hypothetical protein